MTDELKPCPFCGGKPKVYQRGTWGVKCTCGGKSFVHHYGKTEAEAIAAWNARPEAEAMVAAAVEKAVVACYAEAWPEDGVYDKHHIDIQEIERATVDLCADAIRSIPHDRTALDAMLAEEREACAKVAEKIGEQHEEDYAYELVQTSDVTAKAIAAAIRERGSERGRG